MHGHMNETETLILI